MRGTVEIAVELGRWALGFLLLWRMRSVPAATVAGDASRVTVIVPARNEAGNLRRLLPSVVPQADEVVVVDDGSSDGTAGVARELGATVVDAGPVPDGWLGKPWACDRGARIASGDVLVFLDADVVVERDGLRRVVAAQRQHGGLVSVQPWHDMALPYELLSMFPNLVGVMGVGAFTIAGDRVRPRGAFGPCLAIDRAVYDAIGGHTAVRDSVVEDVDLARRVSPVTLYGGRGVVRYRMYPDGFVSLFRGWTKNLASGARATHPVVLLLVVGWISGLIQAPLTEQWMYLLYAAQLWWLSRRLGNFGVVGAMTYPVSLAFFLVVFAWSSVRTFVVRSVTWRGRRVRTR